jgi:hypothetical protein
MWKLNDNFNNHQRVCRSEKNIFHSDLAKNTNYINYNNYKSIIINKSSK